MRVSSETYRAVCRNIIKLYIVASRWTIIDIDINVKVLHITRILNQVFTNHKIHLYTYMVNQIPEIFCHTFSKIFRLLPAGHRPATSRVHYTTNCNRQSSAPEDGQNNFPKNVELTGIINKPLLLHLVDWLYYLYHWCTVKQISDNEIYLLIKYIKNVLWRVAKHLSYIEDAQCLKVKRDCLVTALLFVTQYVQNTLRVCYGRRPWCRSIVSLLKVCLINSAVT